MTTHASFHISNASRFFFSIAFTVHVSHLYNISQSIRIFTTKKNYSYQVSYRNKVFLFFFLVQYYVLYLACFYRPSVFYCICSRLIFVFNQYFFSLLNIIGHVTLIFIQQCLKPNVCAFVDRQLNARRLRARELGNPFTGLDGMAMRTRKIQTRRTGCKGKIPATN